ncbi:hypothetical protein HDU96_000980 [Phlyctochytrium bullatum]|nr:hypothetical protein HDU96_000980 [Phlyctochytrium bullatum]
MKPATALLLTVVAAAATILPRVAAQNRTECGAYRAAVREFDISNEYVVVPPAALPDVTTVCQCAEKCRAYPNCQSYTFEAANATAGTPPRCTLKTPRYDPAVPQVTVFYSDTNIRFNGSILTRPIGSFISKDGEAGCLFRCRNRQPACRFIVMTYMFERINCTLDSGDTSNPSVGMGLIDYNPMPVVASTSSREASFAPSAIPDAKAPDAKANKSSAATAANDGTPQSAARVGSAPTSTGSAQGVLEGAPPSASSSSGLAIGLGIAATLIVIAGVVGGLIIYRNKRSRASRHISRSRFGSHSGPSKVVGSYHLRDNRTLSIGLKDASHLRGTLATGSKLGGYYEPLRSASGASIVSSPSSAYSGYSGRTLTPHSEPLRSAGALASPMSYYSGRTLTPQDATGTGYPPEPSSAILNMRSPRSLPSAGGSNRSPFPNSAGDAPSVFSWVGVSGPRSGPALDIRESAMYNFSSDLNANFMDHGDNDRRLTVASNVTSLFTVDENNQGADGSRLSQVP